MSDDKTTVVSLGQTVLMCGGQKCCPSVEKFSDGSIVIHDTDDGRDQHIALKQQSVDKLLEALGVVVI